MKFNKLSSIILSGAIGLSLLSCSNGGQPVNQPGNITQVNVSGSYLTMGIQYGTQQKEGLISYYNNQLRPIYSAMESNPSQKPIVDLVIGSLKAQLPLDFQDFYKGISQSTGLSYDEVLKTAYFYNFDFTGGCSGFSSEDPLNLKNNYLIHSYDGSSNFYKILKDKATVLTLNPNNGDETVTLVTFYGSLGGMMGINNDRVAVQLQNGLLSVPLLPTNPAELARNAMTMPQPTNLLPLILLKNKTFESASNYILTHKVSASASLLLSDNKLNNDIFYITTQQSIMQNQQDIQYPENPYLEFITNTFLNNPATQPIESQVFKYSLQNDSPSKSFGRLNNLQLFTRANRGAPNYAAAWNFINQAYTNGGITMMASESLPDTTYFRILFSQNDNFLKINQTAYPQWNNINILNK